MKLVLFFYTLFSLNVFADVSSELPIYVFEMKPHIYQDKNKVIKGTWYESFEELSRLSGVKFKYQFTSIPRLDFLLERNQPGCNLTLLKTPKRVEKNHINFIFDHPDKIIFRLYQRGDDDRKWTLKNLSSEPHIKLVSYTSVVDEVLSGKGINSELVFDINSVIQLLLHKRIDAFVGSHLAIETLEEFKTKKIKGGIDILPIPYSVGCSKSTPEEILLKLKKGLKDWTLVLR